MAMIMTYREQQLVKAYRACDERGRYMVEQLADHYAEASRPPACKKEDAEDFATSNKPRHLTLIK